LKFAVTGGAGFIGSNIVKLLVKNNHSVIVIDDLRNGKIKNLNNVKDSILFHKIDILDYINIKNLLKDVDGVFHQAALTSVPDSFRLENEYYDVNVKGTKNIFKLAKEFGFKVVYASSSSVYGNPLIIPIKENSERKSLNPYGLTKLEDEFLAEKYSAMDTKIIGLRYFNVYGIGQNPSYAGVISKFLELISNHQPPVINGDGNQKRDFVFVEDVAEANLKAMQNNIDHSFFNVGTGKITSILELANLMINVSGLKLRPIFGPSLEGDVKESQADTSFVEKSLKWKYKTNLEDWLKKILCT